MVGVIGRVVSVDDLAVGRAWRIQKFPLVG